MGRSRRRCTQAVLCAILVLNQIQEVLGSTPVAQYVHVQSASNQETLVTLLPFNSDSHAMTVTISTLPAVGSLYHLSANFITYGYTPMKGTAISSVPTNITSAANYRLVYVAPVAFEATRFQYIAHDDIDKLTSSQQGIVDITPSTNVTLSSSFLFGFENWKINTAAAFNASWSATSTGLLNRFIYRPELPLVVGANNNVRWNFHAPSTYYRDNSRLYGGTLSFHIGSFEGDLTANKYANPVTFVSLHCASCNGGAGLTVAQRSVDYSGGLAAFSYTLSEVPSKGWRKDPLDDRISDWSSPSQCEFIKVLQGLTSFKIHADFTTQHEAIGLDNVQFTAGHDTIPVSCY